jgi:hypothetical protein
VWNVFFFVASVVKCKVFTFYKTFFCFYQGGLSNVTVIQLCTFWTTALRSVEKYLGLEKLYVLGTNCGNYWWISKSVDLEFFVAWKIYWSFFLTLLNILSGQWYSWRTW